NKGSLFTGEVLIPDIPREKVDAAVMLISDIGFRREKLRTEEEKIAYLREAFMIVVSHEVAHLMARAMPEALIKYFGLAQYGHGEWPVRTFEETGGIDYLEDWCDAFMYMLWGGHPLMSEYFPAAGHGQAVAEVVGYAASREGGAYFVPDEYHDLLARLRFHPIVITAANGTILVRGAPLNWLATAVTTFGIALRIDPKTGLVGMYEGSSIIAYWETSSRDNHILAAVHFNPVMGLSGARTLSRIFDLILQHETQPRISGSGLTDQGSSIIHLGADTAEKPRIVESHTPSQRPAAGGFMRYFLFSPTRLWTHTFHQWENEKILRYPLLYTDHLILSVLACIFCWPFLIFGKQHKHFHFKQAKEGLMVSRIARSYRNDPSKQLDQKLQAASHAFEQQLQRRQEKIGDTESAPWTIEWKTDTNVIVEMHPKERIVTMNYGLIARSDPALQTRRMALLEGLFDKVREGICSMPQPLVYRPPPAPSIHVLSTIATVTPSSGTPVNDDRTHAAGEVVTEYTVKDIVKAAVGGIGSADGLAESLKVVLEGFLRSWKYKRLVLAIQVGVGGSGFDQGRFAHAVEKAKMEILGVPHEGPQAESIRPWLDRIVIVPFHDPQGLQADLEARGISCKRR
ncbi:MAG: hypothetical protein PHS37_06610, partial [Candidatus Omnitrophica bacterium]|nr:hypothetical protein [Candidatus Omnitrophota bacterium]